MYVGCANYGDMHFVFDMNQTLVRMSHTHGHFLAGRIPCLDSTRFDVEMKRRMQELDTSPALREQRFVLNAADREASRLEWIKIMMAAVNTSQPGVSEVDLIEEACGASYDRAALPPQWECYPDTRDVLKILVDDNHTISLLSNFDARAEAIFEEHLCGFPWRSVDFSFRTGFLKPEARAFTAHERSLGEHGSNLVMVGDDLYQDGAARLAAWQYLQVCYPHAPLRTVISKYIKSSE
jgi:FMN phosphatase YigB (HAD superfamily)